MASAGLSSLQGQDLPAATPVEEEFVYDARANWLTGQGIEPGGFLFPHLFVNAAAGAFEPGAGAEDFAASPHEPQNEWGITSIHLHLDFEFSDTLTGAVTGFGSQGLGHVWEAEMEEAFLHYRLNDTLSVGGGQFLNVFGFQQDLHPHDWFFVNQNLLNSRLLNEAHLSTQGGEILLGTPKAGLLSLGFGGVRSHSHDHAHGHGHGEEEHEGHEHEEEHVEEHEEDFGHDGEHRHLHEFDLAGFQSWVASADYRFRLPFDDSITQSLSLAVGENGFGRGTAVYGGGIRKVWKGHDHGHGGPDFCSGATMLQAELVGRKVDALLEDGDAIDFDDYGYSTSLHHGLSDRTTASLRHDWISAVDIAEIADRHRLSAALTAYVDPDQRVRSRLQYDYTQDSTIGAEHAAWFEIQLQWGGVGGSHAGHGH